MISLLNFIDTGFIITLGLLLLVSGAIMLYCYRRLNILEDSVIQHGKILQNFIMNHNNQMMSYNQVFGGQGNFNSGAHNLEKISEENEIEEVENGENGIEEVEEVENGENEDDENGENDDNLKIVNLEDRIVVSDDESDNESNNESDNDSSSDSNSSDNDSESDKENPDDEENPDEVTAINEEVAPSNEEDDFLNNIPIDLETLNMNVHSKLVNLNLDMDIGLDLDLGLDDDKSFAQEKRNFSKMKVDELKTLVVTKNLMDNDNAQKMKKNDLVKLLQE
jgi:hypothetical protein